MEVKRVKTHQNYRVPESTESKGRVVTGPWVEHEYLGLNVLQTTGLSRELKLGSVFT